jgi:hypothetical protein
MSEVQEMSDYYIVRANAKYPEVYDTWSVFYRQGVSR